MYVKSPKFLGLKSALKKQNTFFIVWLITSFLFTFLIRLPNLQHEVINWDESTFIISSADILKGHLPYIFTLDNKPPVLYFTIAVALLLWKSVISVRLLGALLIWGTSLFVFLIIRKNHAQQYAFILSLLFIAMMDAPFAQHTSSEVVAIFYLFAAIWLLNNFYSKSSSFIAGLLMSLAILVRTNLFITAVAGGFYLLLLYLKEKSRVTLIRGFLYITGGIIPPALIFLIYAINNQTEYFKLGLITIPMSYSAARINVIGVFLRLGYLWLKYCWTNPGVAILTTLITIILLGAIINQFKQQKSFLRSFENLKFTRIKIEDKEFNNALIYLCFLATFVSILISGGVYAHYLIQLFPFITIILADWTSKINQKRVRSIALLLSILAILSTLYRLPGTFLVIHHFDQLENEYTGHKIAEVVSDAINDSDEIWAIEYHIALLYLDKNPIIPLVTHPSNLGKSPYIQALSQFDPFMQDPFETILAKKPKVIIVSQNIKDGSLTDAQNDTLLEYLEKYYSSYYMVSNVKVFVRNTN